MRDDRHAFREHDAHDDSLGTGTAGTANVWRRNRGRTENRPGLTYQPWAVIAPALMLAALTLGINLLADAYARSMNTSAQPAVPGTAIRPTASGTQPEPGARMGPNGH